MLVAAHAGHGARGREEFAAGVAHVALVTVVEVAAEDHRGAEGEAAADGDAGPATGESRHEDAALQRGHEAGEPRAEAQGDAGHGVPGA